MMNSLRRKAIVLFALAFLAVFSGLRGADRISVKLTGGMNYGIFGDVNAGVRGYLDLWRDQALESGGTCLDGKKPLHLGVTGAIDIICKINDSYGVGLGVGYVRAHNTSTMSISLPGETVAYTGSALPDARAVPVRLSVFNFIPINKRICSSFVLGFDTYFAQFKSDYWPAGAGNSFHQKAHAVGVGVRYGAGLEFKLASRLAFVIEAQGTYAKIRNFHGTLEAGGSSLPYEESGPLYYWEESVGMIIPKLYPRVLVQGTEPSGPYSNVRKARIDFSGFSALAGFKIRF